MACDITVAVATHKAYRMPTDGVYMPLQVGKALHPQVDLGMKCDNDGDNISSLNAQYSELTGLYWLWKNCSSRYQGLVHYRRHFAKSDSPKLYGNEDERFAAVAQRNDYETLLDATRKIIAESTPEYLDAFDVQMDRNSAHLFNMFIMRKDLLDEYCSWMFPIVGELTKRIDSSDYTPFELRYPGRISEILLDVWLNTKRYPYAEMPIVSPEPVDWMKKGTGFLMAKFVGKKYVKSC